MLKFFSRSKRPANASKNENPSPVKTKHPNDQSKKRRSLLPTLKSKVKNDRRRDVAHHTYNPNSNGANQKPTTPQPVKVGDVVWHKERKCVVRFLGKTHFGGEITYAGLELYRAIGKNDGAVEGVRYFQCPMNFGLFVPVDTLVQHPPANFSESSAPVTPKQARSFKLLSPKATNKKQAQERTPTSPVHVHTEPQPKQTVASPVSEAPKQLTEDKPQQPPVVMRREKFKGSKKGSRSSMCSPGTTSALTRPQLRHSYSEASTPTNVQPWNLFEEFQLSLQNDKGEPGSALREARSLFNCPSPEPKTEASERIFTTKGDDSPEERPRSHIIPLNDTGDMMSTDMEKYLETIFEAEHSNGNTLDRLDNMPTHRRDRLMPVSASFHDTGEKENLLDEDNKSPKSSEGPLLQDSDHLYDDVPKESDMSSLDDDGEPFNQVADLPESPPVHIPTIERPIMGLAGVDSVVSDDETESLLSSAVDKLKSYENTAPSTLATASPINRPTRPTTLSTKPKKNSLSTTGKQRDISHPSSSLSALNKSQSSSSVNSTAKTQSLRTQRTEVKAKRPLAKPSSKGRIAAPVKRAKSKEKVIENQEKVFEIAQPIDDPLPCLTFIDPEPSLPSSISSPRESNLVETEMKEHVILESRFHTFTKNRKQPENLQSTQEYGSLPQMKLTSPAGATFSSKLEQLDQGDKRIIELESEINHLKSANEENEAEFTRLQTSLDASNRGFTAFAVLVQYLTCQLNAFSIGALEEKVEKLQLNFAVALEQLGILEIITLVNHSSDAHSERDGALERLDQMTADHLAEVEQLNRSHQEKIRNVEDSLREKMSDDFEQVMVRSRLEREELMSRYETRLALAHKQHQTELAQEEQQHLNLREADRIKYEATLAKLRAKFLDEIDIANTLSQKALEQVTEQRDEIMRNYESLQARNCALEKEINDLSNKRFLEPLPDDVAIDDPRRSGSIPRIPVPPEQIDQEVASLRSVIEIRDEELHRLRRKMADYQLLQEELMTANKEIDTLKRQNEAIQEILDRKKEAEKFIASYI